MSKWLAAYVAAVAAVVALGVAEPGQANTSRAAVSPLTQTGKLADRLPTEAAAQQVRTVRVVYPSHLAGQ